MSMQDVIGHMDLAVFPQIALVLFGATFAAVVIRLARPGQRESLAEASRLPLEDAALAGEGSRGE